MHFNSGIYLRADVNELISAISARLEELGYLVEAALTAPSSPPSEKGTTISLMPWTDKWVWLHFDDDKDWMSEIIDGVKDGPLYTDIIHCYYEPGLVEYSYTCFRSGKLMETFSSGGPGLGTIVFKSDLRKISIGSIIDAEKFMTES